MTSVFISAVRTGKVVDSERGPKNLCLFFEGVYLIKKGDVFFTS